MRNVTDILLNYLEAKRHLWNLFFRDKFHSLTECGVLDHYENIDRHLFLGLVLDELGKSLPDDFPFGQHPIQFLKVMPKDDSAILNMMVSEPLKKGFGNSYDFPTNFTITPDTELMFMEFFEWDRYDYVTYPYYLVRIQKFPKYPELEGRNALIKTWDAIVFVLSDRP